MLSKHQQQARNQLIAISLDDLVPEDHLVRKIDKVINFDFIYPLVEHTYSHTGRPSVDPVVLIKLVLIQYLFGIRSMRQTIKEVETNMAYRWFLGYDFNQKILTSLLLVKITCDVLQKQRCSNTFFIAF